MKNIDGRMISNKICRGYILRIAVGIMFVTTLLVGDASAATPINSCTTISLPGEYVLTQNISTLNRSNSTLTLSCIDITSSDVTFDGQGYSIVGPKTILGLQIQFGEPGVNVFGSTDVLTNVTVKNLRVQEWQTGIYYNMVSNGTIANIIADQNAGYGIRLSNSTYITLTNNNASYTIGSILGDDGIALDSGSSYNTLTGNTANSNGNDGIYLDSSSNNALSGNTANSNNVGIELGSSSNNALTDNMATASSNNFAGISLASSSNNNLIGNTASSKTYGIYLADSWNNNLANNTATTNNFITSIAGIELLRSNNNNLTGNDASNNRIGIDLSGASNNNITGNTASSNNEGGVNDGGIRLDNAKDNLIYNNYFNNIHNAIDFVNSTNTWNITKTAGTNIVGGPYLGGNFWDNPSGIGFSSRTCPDTDGDGICDLQNNLNSNNIDYLPLSSVTPTPTPTVVPVNLTTITVSPSTDQLNVNGTQMFTATALDQNGAPMAGVNLSWTSSNTTVGTVSPSSAMTDMNGTATTTFTALAPGTTMVNASNGSVTGSAIVTVTTPPLPPSVLTKIVVSPSTASLTVGGNQTFNATALDQNNSPMANISITWTSNNTPVGNVSPTTATTDAFGNATTTFTASSARVAMVTANNGTTMGSANVTVSTTAVVPSLTIAVSPAAANLAVNGTQVFTATALDQNNSPMANISITWASDNTTVGAVAPVDAVTNASGMATTTFTAAANGTAMVTATNNTVIGSATVTVTKPTPLPITNPVVITLKVSPYDVGIATITSPIGMTTTSTSTKITISSDSKVTLNVTPNDGYRFDRFVDEWNGNTFTTSLNPWTDTMVSNDVVTAVLVPVNNTVVDTIRVSPAGAGTVQAVSAVGTTTPPTTTLIIPVNSKVTFKAIPNEGFKFDHWLDTWGISSSFKTKQNPWTDTMSSSDITTAVFVPIRKFGGNDDGNDKQGNIDDNKGMDDNKTD